MNKKENGKMFSLEENTCYYKKEYQRAKTKLEFVQAIGLTIFYVMLFAIWIMR